MERSCVHSTRKGLISHLLLLHYSPLSEDVDEQFVAFVLLRACSAPAVIYSRLLPAQHSGVLHSACRFRLLWLLRKPWLRGLSCVSVLHFYKIITAESFSAVYKKYKNESRPPAPAPIACGRTYSRTKAGGQFVCQTPRSCLVLHVQQNKHNTDTPALQEDDCRVHRAKSVCDSFNKYDGILGHWPACKITTPQSCRELIWILLGSGTTRLTERLWWNARQDRGCLIEMKMRPGITEYSTRNDTHD